MLRAKQREGPVFSLASDICREERIRWDLSVLLRCPPLQLLVATRPPYCRARRSSQAPAACHPVDLGRRSTAGHAALPPGSARCDRNASRATPKRQPSHRNAARRGIGPEGYILGRQARPTCRVGSICAGHISSPDSAAISCATRRRLVAGLPCFARHAAGPVPGVHRLPDTLSPGSPGVHRLPDTLPARRRASISCRARCHPVPGRPILAGHTVSQDPAARSALYTSHARDTPLPRRRDTLPARIRQPAPLRTRRTHATPRSPGAGTRCRPEVGSPLRSVHVARTRHRAPRAPGHAAGAQMAAPGVPGPATRGQPEPQA